MELGLAQWLFQEEQVYHKIQPGLPCSTVKAWEPANQEGEP